MATTIEALKDVHSSRHFWSQLMCQRFTCRNSGLQPMEMLHISPRTSGQSFNELPFEEEILEFIRFTKVIIHHCMSKDPSIPRRNKINWHYVRDDSIFSTIKVVSRHQNTQQYGAILPIELTNDEIRNTKAYKEYYAFATEEAVPKPKASARRKRSGYDTSITPPTATTTPKLTAAAKGKQPAKAKNEGTGSKPGVLDVPTDESEEELSWNSSDDEGADDQETAKYDEQDDVEGGGNDEEESESDEEDDNEETRKEENFDPIHRTPESSEDEGNGEEDQGLNVNEEEHVEEEEEDELYRDVNINQGRGLQATLEVEDTHVTLTPINSDGQQESSSVSSQFVTSMLNPTSDVAVSNIPGIVYQYMNQQMNEAVRVVVQIQTDRLRDSYQRENDEFLRTINENMKRIIKEQVKGQVKEQVSRILPRIKLSVNAQLEAEVLTRSSHSSRTSYAVVADLSEMELKKILIEKMEGNKSIKRDDDDQDEGPSAGSDRGSKRRREGKELESASAPLETATMSADRSTTGSKSQQVSASESAFAEEPPKKPLTPDRDWNKTLPAVQGSTQTWISELAKQADSRSSFNELMDTPLDFSNFIMNQLRVDTLTPELLAGPTYELMKGSCTSLIELEYHLEEVYKATTDQLDWINPEGQQYPHNLLQPLSLIPDNRGRHVIPFAHFINNDLDYLRGGASSHKCTTSVTKTKATDYENIKWIEDLFYGFAINRESALDVYSKRRIIAVTDLKIVKWHSYKHLDWISVRRDDDKIYKFKEGDFKRLRL
nr:hypothetical protein [Tanacetum cinerariifolium]